MQENRHIRRRFVSGEHTLGSIAAYCIRQRLCVGKIWPIKASDERIECCVVGKTKTPKHHRTVTRQLRRYRLTNRRYPILYRTRIQRFGGTVEQRKGALLVNRSAIKACYLQASHQS